MQASSGVSKPQETVEEKVDQKPYLIIVFITSIIFRVLSVTPVINFIPVYLTKGFSLNPENAAQASALYFLGCMLGSYISGRVSRQTGPFKPILIFTGLLVPIVYFLSLPTPLWLAVALIFALGISAGGCVPTQNLMLGILGSRMAKGGLFGFFMSVTTIANSLSPAMFGLISDKWGLRAGIKIFTLPGLTGFCILLMLAIFSPVSLSGKRQTIQ